MNNVDEFAHKKEVAIVEESKLHGSKKEKLDFLKKKYKEMDGKIYEITTSVQEDDDNEKEFGYVFRKPRIASYDRYVKTAQASGTRALKAFVLDNICDEQYDELQETLEEYPAMAIGLGEKLLNMLGLSKDTVVKKL